MKQLTLPKFGALLLVVIGAIVLVAQFAIPQSVPNPISLRLLASQSGNYISYAQPTIFPKYDLNQLTSQSTDIITGTAGTNICNLSPDETLVTTDFQITVDSVKKGHLGVGQTITVSALGGRVIFKQPNGTLATAEIRAPWFKKMTEGHRYFLF